MFLPEFFARCHHHLYRLYIEIEIVEENPAAVIDHGQIIALAAPEVLINHHFRETALEFVTSDECPRELLNTLPGVTQSLFEKGHQTLYSTDVPRTMVGLFELVSTGGLTFSDMVVRQATLEDVFLKLTGRRIRS